IHVYGGKSLLDAFQTAIPVPDLHLHLLDHGMALVTVMLLLVGHRKASPRTSRALILLALLLTVTMPDVRFNTSATMAGAAFFLGLYRTLSWSPIRDGRRLRDAVPVALLSAGACTLRQNYLAAVGIFLALEFGVPIVQAFRFRPLTIDRASLRRAAATAGTLFLCLSPWWAMSFHWCRSFLFPIVPGNYNKDYDYFRPLGAFAQLRYLWENISFCFPVKAVPLFLVAALTTIDRVRFRTVVHFAIAAFLGFIMLIRNYPDIDAPNLGRYYFGFTFPALLAIGLAVGDGAGRRFLHARADRAAGLTLVLAAIGLQVYSDHDQTTKQWTQYLSMIQPEFEHPAPWRALVPDPNYARLQNAIPLGARIAVMVDQFDRFDLRRNPIESLDMVGAISPPPGLPLFGPADSVADYLVSQGYRYLIVVHPDTANYLFRRDAWQHTDAYLDVYKRTARFYLRAFDVFDELRTTRVQLGQAGNMTALDLTRRSK
ncbi:MAG: hypothetical protein ABSC94_31920, partial [Polyangiaceae bacterium]